MDSETGKSVLVDPGGDVDSLIAFVEGSESELIAIVLTHSHIDHCAAVAGFLREYGEVPLFGHEVEAEMRSGISKQAAMFTLDPNEYENCPEPTTYLEDGDTLEVGAYSATSMFTPGHSPGHLAFFFEETDWNIDGQEGTSPVLIAGDALFNGSIGRTDLPGGDHAQLINSIKTKLLPLPEDTIVLPGHGPETTIGKEARSNPFLV